MNCRFFRNGLLALMLVGAGCFGLQNSAFAQTKLEDIELYVVGDLPDKILGSEDAETTIVEYASMTCPHCKSFHENTLPDLKENYIDTGKVRFIFREYPLDTAAMAAAMIARCAPEAIFFEVVDFLLEKQEDWTGEEDVYNALLGLSRNFGFTQESFDACLADEKLLENIVWIKNRASKEFKVRSTPTIIVNGEVLPGALSFEELERVIQSQ